MDGFLSSDDKHVIETINEMKIPDNDGIQKSQYLQFLINKIKSFDVDNNDINLIKRDIEIYKLLKNVCNMDNNKCARSFYDLRRIIDPFNTLRTYLQGQYMDFTYVICQEPYQELKNGLGPEQDLCMILIGLLKKMKLNFKYIYLNMNFEVVPDNPLHYVNPLYDYNLPLDADDTY